MGINQRGIAHLLVLGLILLAVLAAGGYFLMSGFEKVPQSMLSENAGEAGKTVDPTASVMLEADGISNSQKLTKGSSFALVVKVKSEQPLNLFSAQINYPREFLTAKTVRELPDAAVQLWVEKKIDSGAGLVKLTGGTPSPGFIPDSSGQVTISIIDFEVTGEKIPESFNISQSEVQLFRNSDSKLLENVNSEPFVYGKSVLGTTADGSMTMSPETIQVNAGCTFDVTINLDAAGHLVDGADAVIKFDPGYVSPVKLKEGSITPDLSVFKIFTRDNYFYFSNVMPFSFSSKGSMGIVTLKALKETGSSPTELAFKFNPSDPQNTTDSNIVEHGTIKEILGSVSGTKITIGTGECSAAVNESTTSASVATSSAILASKEEGDANGDGQLDLSDVSALLMDYNKKGDSLQSDLNGDGRVNVLDFSKLVSNLFKKGVLQL